MNVVLSVIGKFHTFDLARQLHRRGALTAIFSGYPYFKLKKEKIPRKFVHTFPWVFTPYTQLVPSYYRVRWFWDLCNVVSLDWYVASKLPACDVFLSLSSCGLQTGKKAKKQGAKYVCDRGSSHIRFQDQVLREEYHRQRIPFQGIDPRIIAREEAEYDLADAITVPSTFALESFLKFGIPREKLRLASYGVDLSMFRPTGHPSEDEFNILFAGRLSVQKGVQYLLDAFENVKHKKKHLTLVGPLEQELQATIQQLRQRPDITITGHIPQSRLREYMSTSHVMVLPSVQEGLALVQAQAMACGCPVISSEHTGASNLFTHGEEGFIVPIRDSNAIAHYLQILADDPGQRAQMSEAALQRVKLIGGWDTYGDTMYRIFTELVES